MSTLPPDPLLDTAPVHGRDVEDHLPWWPRAALPQAMARLGSRFGQQVDLGPPPPEGDETDWMAWACDRLCLRMTRQTLTRADLPRHLPRAAPALMWNPAGTAFLLLWRGGVVIGPDGRRHRLTQAQLAAALLPAPHPSLWRQGRRVAALVQGGRDLTEAICAAAEPAESAAVLWSLRPAETDLRAALLFSGLPGLAALSLALAFALQGAEVALWAGLGAAALTATAPSPLWLVALMLLPLGLQAAQALTADALSRRITLLVRRRLMAGALHLPEAHLRAEGPEGLLARGLEAQGIETAISALVQALPLAMAAVIWAGWVMAQGGFPMGLPLLFGMMLALQALAFRGFVARFAAWTQSRRTLAARMTGWLIGHRNLPALGRPETILTAEDPHLAAHRRAGQAMDRASMAAFALLPNGWTILCLGGLAGLSHLPQGVSMAVTLGGVLLGARALVTVSGAWAAYAGVRVGFAQIAPLWDARPTPPETTFPPLPKARTLSLTLSGLRLSRPGRGLHLCADAMIGPAARLWLTGASGSGKSTLLRRIAQGDLDGQGEICCGPVPLPPRHAARAVALVPQFQDNHVLAGSFAFNLLLARTWPAGPADLARAEAVARDLGLGDLIDRMPGGLSTQLGETGWQLSQGERSRLFLARAVLQDAPVVALDESLAALDPETERTCLDAVHARCEAVILVRHG